MTLVSQEGRFQGAGTTSEVDTVDFFRDQSLVTDPYPYLDALRAECPVRLEPHHGVYMVTGCEEACAVLTDTSRFSSCTR